ncbi:MAG: DUF2341 domain-containing protein [Chitinispirillaceae bacterium]|nr:DUF2341 domain-containing protein [Chitinispirillaceae bacterium]
MKAVVYLTLIYAITTFLQCTPVNVSGAGGEGNGSETVARGVIIDSTGEPAAGISIKLLPSGFNPVSHDTLPFEWQTITDINGEYCLTGIPEGTYSIEAGSNASGVKALIRSITVLSTDTVKTINACWLRKTGAFIVNLLNQFPREGDYVYLPGTSVFTELSGEDCRVNRVVLSSVPTGVFSELMYVNKSDSGKTNLLTDSVIMTPGDTIVSAYASWKYRMKLLLNTSTSGADIPGNVYRFPVIVRLNAATFDFSHARNDGKDIRFAKKDGTLLYHETERWDGSSGKAELWVLVDTIFGNDSLQGIMMYWGNTEMAAESETARVFDTAQGFEGVWHLCDDSGDLFRDATSNHIDGFSSDTAQPSPAEGVIGKCRNFNGISNFITMPNSATTRLSFPEQGDFSISAWVYQDTYDNKPSPVVGKGITQYCLQSISSSANSTTWEFVEFGKVSTWQVSASVAALREWTLLTAVRQGNRQLLYLNGVLVDSTVTEWKQVFPRDTSGTLSIGKFINVLTSSSDPAFTFFKGSIDEVRVVSVACNSDWVRLCYMNQRSDDRLVILK